VNRRAALTIAVKAMFVVIAAAFLYVLLRSLAGPSLISNPQRVFDDVQIGQTALRRFNGERVWATRLTQTQRQNAQELAKLVRNYDSGCLLASKLCVISAKTSLDGIEIMFTESEPPQLRGGTPWFGGYVDPVNGAVYDRLGRAYKLELYASESQKDKATTGRDSLPIILLEKQSS